MLKRVIQKQFFLIFCCLFAASFVLITFVSNSSDEKEENTKKQRSKKTENIFKLITDKDNRYVIYNRVPKCGSMSLTTLGYRLGGANKFRVASPYEDGEKPTKNEQEQLEFISFIHSQPPGYLYIRHQYFIDFTKFGHKQPIYINMIRDPVERFQSFYYFSRFGNERGGGASARMSDERRHESIDECIRKRRQECLKPYWQVVPYFCGQNPGCMSRSQWALDRAKENIKKHYVIVGILEELENFLEIVEIFLPKYFKNARSVYNNPENKQMRFETRTRKKEEISEAAKEFLRTETSLKLEHDLYRFVKAELERMKSELL